MDIVVIKGERPGERERMWITRNDGSTVDFPIHMGHDLPHLVVESWFGLEFGFWGLIAAGAFSQEIEAFHARDARKVKDGRHGVMMGLARQSPVSGETQDPLVAQHEDELIAAKALTNAFRPWGDGTDNAEGVRARLAPAADANAVVRNAIAELTNDEIEGLQEALEKTARDWDAIPPGGRIELRWPLTPVRG